MLSEYTVTYVTDVHNWDSDPAVHGPVPFPVVTRDIGAVVIEIQRYFGAAHPDDTELALHLSESVTEALHNDAIALIGTGWNALSQGQWAELQVRREWVHE